MGHFLPVSRIAVRRTVRDAVRVLCPACVDRSLLEQAQST